ncbi:piggyBac transposable element-derived protein 5-like [Saccostrea echinata]|uniref:piggyBac transposable element-derived protein 5-like n=1 Tax=Saccostrea echinata TaxID=191078 RepID=UPI002A81EFFA|nr:piggyBac transposable element-derived protein 5-like [Saccostrea echinata]
MAENILDIFLSGDEDFEFEGFTRSEIDATETRSIRSDISFSDSDDSSSSEESEEEIDEETWTRMLSKPNVVEFREEVGAAFVLEEDKKELDFFHRFFPVSLVDNIVEETNQYAARCIEARLDKIWTPTTFLEMMAFLGIHLVFSVLGVPSYTLPWKSPGLFNFQAYHQS